MNVKKGDINMASIDAVSSAQNASYQRTEAPQQSVSTKSDVVLTEVIGSGAPKAPVKATTKTNSNLDKNEKGEDLAESKE